MVSFVGWVGLAPTMRKHVLRLVADYPKAFREFYSLHQTYYPVRIQSSDGDLTPLHPMYCYCLL
jgi:hypothetical protein